MNGDRFNLPTKKDELESIENYRGSIMYRKATRSSGKVKEDNFPSSQLEFTWSVASDERWDPKNSFLRIQARLTDSGSAPLLLADGIAPAMNLPATIFQNMRLEMNDTEVSKIEGYLPQVDTICNRIDKSKSWLDSVGKGTNFWAPSYLERLNDISTDGVLIEHPKFSSILLEDAQIGIHADNTVTYDYTEGGAGERLITITHAVVAATGDCPWRHGDAMYIGGVLQGYVDEIIDWDPAIDGVSGLTLLEEGAKITDTADGTMGKKTFTNTYKKGRKNGIFEMRWTPPLSIFKQDKLLPMGSYKLTINTETPARYQEAAIESLAAKVGTTNFIFQIDNIEFYFPLMKSNRIKDLTYWLDLKPIKVQTAVLNTGTTQNDFTVPKSTYGLSIAYQDKDINASTLYSPTKFKIRSNKERALTMLRVTYGNTTKPSPDADPKWIDGTATVLGEDLRVRRWQDSLFYMNAYDDQGGSESIQDWDERGAFYHFDFIRDGSDTATSVNVNQTMGSAYDTDAQAKVLLFAHQREFVKVEIKNNIVVAVTKDFNTNI